MEELEPYMTSNTSLAAYLRLRGMAVLSTKADPNDSGREIFIFLDELRRPDLEAEYNSNEGEFKSYHRALRELNGLVADAKRKRNGNR